MPATNNSPLHLRAGHAQVVQSAIQHWLDSNTISSSQATRLAETIEIQTFDWQRFAKYSLRLAVICLFIAIFSTILERRFAQLFHRLLALPAYLRGSVTALVAVGVHVLAYRRSLELPKQKYLNEGYHGVGAIFFALAAAQAFEQIQKSYDPPKADENVNNESPDTKEDEKAARQRKKREFETRERLHRNAIMGVLLGLSVTYGTVALLSASNLIWSCAIIALAYASGATTGYAMGTYYIGMWSPIIYTALGVLLIVGAQLMRSYSITIPLWSTTRIWGLLYLFVSLWIASLGYGGGLGDQRFSTKARMILWSLALAGTAAGCTWHGLRFGDSTTKGFGLTFIGISLYTRFFEMCWGWSKTVFFTVLAGGFAIVGKYAESVWNLQVGEL
ncbi:hypothetical protein LIA77_06776 [Sarocladium implicatum]|nr:hypothetical protein LIA77_06776 [Sarocladium implicatum]